MNWSRTIFGGRRRGRKRRRNSTEGELAIAALLFGVITAYAIHQGGGTPAWVAVLVCAAIVLRYLAIQMPAMNRYKLPPDPDLRQREVLPLAPPVVQMQNDPEMPEPTSHQEIDPDDPGPKLWVPRNFLDRD